MPKIKIKEGRLDLIHIIKDLKNNHKEDLANELRNLITRNGIELPEISKIKDFGTLRIIQKSKLQN